MVWVGVGMIIFYSVLAEEGDDFGDFYSREEKPIWIPSQIPESHKSL